MVCYGVMGFGIYTHNYIYIYINSSYGFFTIHLFIDSFSYSLLIVIYFQTLPI